MQSAEISAHSNSPTSCNSIASRKISTSAASVSSPQPRIPTRLSSQRLIRKSTISNAKAFLALVEHEGSFAKFLWSFVGGKPKKNRPKSLKDVPTKSPESDAMAKGLQKAGFKFVGSTICYAFMQASGMVDDHVVGCHRHRE